jgi:hypothetical protein
MKQVIGLIVASTLSSVALADIPQPPRADGEQIVVEGQAAVELNDALKGRRQLGDSLRTRSSSYNIFQSSDMKTLIYCETVNDRMNPENSGTTCVIRKSQKKQPAFNPPRRMG